MKNIFILGAAVVFLSVSNVHARQHQKVDHCDYDAQTYIETCYGTDGKLLNGWAVEGYEPENAVKNRRQIRKLVRAQSRNEDKSEEYATELKEITQPYTLSKFRNGKRDGLSREIDVYNYELKRVEYSKGRKNGNYEAYYPNHRLQATATYKDGVLSGVAVFYNSRGKKIGTSRYRKGILLRGYCRNKNGDKIALPTNNETIITEVEPCPDVSKKD